MHEHIPDILKKLSIKSNPVFDEKLAESFWRFKDLVRNIPYYKNLLSGYGYYDTSEELGNTIDKDFKEIPLVEWMCTDTHVGLYAIFLKGKFLCYGFQPYRKSDYVFYWKDKKDVFRVKRYLDSYKGKMFNEDENESIETIGDLKKEFNDSLERNKRKTNVG